MQERSNFISVLYRVDDGGAILRRNLSTAFMRGLGRASVMPLRAARSMKRRRHRPELPFMPGRGADIGPESQVILSCRLLTGHTMHARICWCSMR